VGRFLIVVLTGVKGSLTCLKASSTRHSKYIPLGGIAL
jgi:hypothetical protein